MGIRVGNLGMTKGSKGDKGDAGADGAAGATGASGVAGGLGKWSGKTLALFGDSMTNGDYNSELIAKAGVLIPTTYGLSGATTSSLVGMMTSINDRDATRFNDPAPDFTTIDLVLIQIGTNVDATLGTIADISTDSYLDIPVTYADETTYLNTFPDTFYGNLGICIEWVKEHNQDCRIYLITPPQEDDYDHTIHRDAMIELGKFYSVPVINAIDNAGIELKQLMKYSSDGTHLNVLGNDLWGNYVGEQLNVK